MPILNNLRPNLSNPESLGLITAFGETQEISNFSTASPALKTAEALGNLDRKGALGNFSSVTKGVGLKVENSKNVVFNEQTNQEIASKFVPVVQSTPASAWETGSDNTQNFKVTISQSPIVYASKVPSGISEQGILVLDVMPTIDENRSAAYKSFTPLHHPGEILKYESTASRSWTVASRLVCRNSAEASKNLYYLNLIRSWTMPFYGVGTGNTSLKDKLGAPPPILTLNAYGSQMIGPVKCVLETYNWQFPNDCDYIPTEDGIPFPVILNISLTLKESWSPSEYSSFNLEEYRDGNLQEAFGGTTDGAGGKSGSDNSDQASNPLPSGATKPDSPINVSPNIAARSIGATGIKDSAISVVKKNISAPTPVKLPTSSIDALNNFNLTGTGN